MDKLVLILGFGGSFAGGFVLGLIMRTSPEELEAVRKSIDHESER